MYDTADYENPLRILENGGVTDEGGDNLPHVYPKTCKI